MGTGASGDSGSFAAITPDMLPPEAPGDGSRLKALIAKLEAVAAAAPAALAEDGDKGDATRIWLARHVRDLAVEASEAGIMWEDGFRTAEAQCPVPLPEQRKPASHRKRPDYLKPLAVAVAGAWRITGRHAGAAKAAAVAHAKLTAIITALAVGTTAAGGALVLARAPASHAAAWGATAGQVTGGAGVWAADPVTGPQQQKPGHAVTRKPAGKGKRLSETDAASPPVSYPSYSPAPSASPPPGSSGPSQSSQPPPVQGTLTLSTTAIDLTTVPAATITLTAEGGHVDWAATGTGGGPLPSDIILSQDHGGIFAGVTVVVTVSLAPQASQDGQSQVSFEINGTTVTVLLPSLPSPPPPAPAGSISVAATSIPA